MNAERPVTGPKRRVLIVCTGNACRSQMAEALWRSEAGDRYDVYSAGTMPAGVHPLARRAVEELGIDTSEHFSKSVFDFPLERFDLVITVCDSAREVCVNVQGHPGHLHWPVEDPIVAAGSVEERMVEFRRIRDLLHQRIRKYLAESAAPAAAE